MNRRGDVVVTVTLLLSVLLMVGSAACSLAGYSPDMTQFGITACYLVAWAIYLEVYSHRG